MKPIVISPSETADTRTCDWSRVSKEQLLNSSKQHISDVSQGLYFLIDKIKKTAQKHDFTKINNIEDFYNDFKTGFKNTYWWNMHQQEERHHFNTKEFIKEDVDLIDVLEQIVDGVMAGMARSGQYREEIPDTELLLRAYRNTIRLLLDNLEVRSEQI